MSMKIDLLKKVYTPEEIKFVKNRLKAACKKGYLQRKYEKNIYLSVAYRGVEEKGISAKWNVKIYTYSHKKKGHSIVCVDKLVLSKLVEKDYDSFIPPDLPVLKIDDAGWGFPLCGIMVGVSNEQEVKSAIVSVEYFRDDTKNHFNTRKYLTKYTDLALELVEQFGASPSTHRIEICTGYVNQPLRGKLRKFGYDVRVVEIKGMLQDKLESIFKNYVSDEIGADIYYDPKEIKKSEIAKKYKKSVQYGLQHCPHQIKTGWESLNGI